MARATQVWRGLRSLSYVDHLSSGPGEEVTSYWEIVAPDRLAYQVVRGSEAVIIGGRRWDKPPGSTWTESPQDPPLSQPLPFWVSVRDAHLLGAASVAGRPVWLVSFFDPATPAWFEVSLDKKTLRTLSLRMTTTAHFMHDTYSSFDRTPAITPPDQG
jgi:copper transport protein